MRAANVVARQLTVPLALGLVLTASDASVASAMAAKPADEHSASARLITLTNTDNGRTVRVSSGDEIRVRLTGYNQQGITWTWSEPEASAPDNLKRIEGSETSTGDATAVFRTTRVGQIQIVSQGSCTADPGQMCPDTILPWKATIKVVQ